MDKIPDMVDAEELFGQFVVELGLVNPDRVKECLAQLRKHGSSRDNGPRLAHLLIEKGYLDMAKVDRTVTLTQVDQTVLDKTVQENPDGPTSPQPPPKKVKGEVFGKYIKNRILGTGGMGEVWKAWDTELHRWVAIKFLLRGEESDLARLRREAQTAAKLDHPGITSVYEAGENYIVMQLINGESLSTLPQGDFRLVAAVMKKAAEAVHFAHQHGIMHRDIKPANILFQEANADESSTEPFQVFLTDFGLAKPMNIDSSLSVTGAIMGTPSYMSPEQAEGRRNLDNRTDIYSLGATLYYLLAGHPPFFDENAYKVARKVIEDAPVAIRKIKPEVPANMETITLKCMEKDPAARYGNALEVAEELDRFLNNEPIHASPISRAESAWRYVKRYRVVLMPSAAAVLLALGILGWIGSSTYLRTREVRREIAHTRSYMGQATGAPHERLKLYRLAGRTIDGALTLSPDNPEARGLRTQINTALEKIESEAEKERKALEDRLLQKKKLTRMARVLGRWERLHETLEELEEIHFDSRLSEEEKKNAQKPSWKKVAAFKDRLPNDPASQSIGMAFAGWSRVVAGHEKEGIDWLNQARSLDPGIPYAAFLKALLRFEEILNEKPLVDAGSIAGVQWWTSPEPVEKAAQIRSLLKSIPPTELWVEASLEDYEYAIEGMLAFVDGRYAEAESAFNEAIAAPEMVVFLADFRLARAQARMHQKDYRGALEDLEEIQDARPYQGLIPFLIGLANCGLSEQRPSEASQIRQQRTRAILGFEKAAFLSKECWQAWVRAGALQEAVEEKKKASTAFQNAMTITSSMKPKPDLPKVQKAITRLKGK